MTDHTTLVHDRLLEKIRALEVEKDHCETRLYGALSKLQQMAAHPAPLIRKMAAEVLADEQLQRDLLKAGTHFAADYLIDRLMPKDKPSFLLGLMDHLKGKAEGGTAKLVLTAISSLLLKRKK